MRPITVLAALAFLLVAGAPAGAQQGLKLTPVLKSTTTMTGQPLQYARTDKPEVTIALAELEPGGEVGRHMHWASGFVYILEGTVTVTMEDGTQHEFRPGQAFVEATNTWHNAKNTGSGPVRLLVVWPGEVGKPNIIRPEASGTAGAGATPAGASGAGPAPGAQPGMQPGAQPGASPQ